MKNISNQWIPLSILALMTLLGACETYGPASRYQNMFPMEHSFYDGYDTSNYYVSARYSGGRAYRPQDKNQTGELSIHKSWVTRWRHSSIGIYGQIGEYKVKDSLKLGYNNFGIRGDFGKSRTYDDNTEIGFNGAFSLSYESGQYTAFRGEFERLNQFPSGIFPKDTVPYAPNRWVRDIQMYFSLRHRFEENKVLSFRFGTGFSFNNVISAYPFLSLSYQFHERMHANLSGLFLTDSGKNGQNRLNDLFSLGLTYSF